MNKRLRKKKRVAEFTSLVFEIFVEYDGKENEWDWLVGSAEFIEFVIMNDFSCGGGGIDNIEGRVVEKREYDKPRKRHDTCTEDDRKSVIGFLGSNEHVVGFAVGPLVDGWNGDYSQPVELSSFHSQNVSDAMLIYASRRNDLRKTS